MIDIDFCGVIPPVVTPLDKNKKFDKASFEKVINRLIDAGVDGLFILGSTGSVAFLTNEERYKVMEAAVDIVQNRIPLLCGVIDMQTNRVIEHIKVAEKLGFDAVVSTAPFYALDDKDVVENHFIILSNSTNLPIFAYDLPVCVNKKLDLDMLIRLAKKGALYGVKDSSADDVSFRLLMIKNEEEGHPLKCFTGHEIVVDGALLGGADGIVPGLANVDPKVFVDMWKASINNDWKQVKKFQDFAAKLMRIAVCDKSTSGFGSGVGGFMTALSLMNIISTNNVCNPSFTLKGDDVEKVKSILVDLGLLGA